MFISKNTYFGIGLTHALILLGSLFTMTSLASEYSLDYDVIGRYEYDDNANLNPINPVSISGGRVMLPARLTMRNERLASSLFGNVLFRRYDESSYNSDDSNLQGDSSYQLERGNIAGGAGYKRSSTQETQIQDDGNTEVGASRVSTTTANVSGNYAIAEKNGVYGAAYYSAVDYANDLNVDGTFIYGNVGISHQWTEHTRLLLQGYANRYENDARIQVTTDTIGLQTGFDSTVSEQLKISMLAGWITATTDYASDVTRDQDDDNSSGYIVDGSLNYTRERDRLSVGLTRRSTPSSNGYLLINNTLDLSYDYEISERSGFTLNLVGGDSNSLDERINNDRIYGQVKLSLSYALSRSWSLTSSYRYQYQNKQQLDSTDSNAITFGVTYKPEKIIWSR